MLEIKRNVDFLGIARTPEYVLENGVELYDCDWNGEVFTNGFDPEEERETGYGYRPIYRPYVDSPEDYEIIGFEEV